MRLVSASQTITFCVDSPGCSQPSSIPSEPTHQLLQPVAIAISQQTYIAAPAWETESPHVGTQLSLHPWSAHVLCSRWPTSHLHFLSTMHSILPLIDRLARRLVLLPSGPIIQSHKSRCNWPHGHHQAIAPTRASSSAWRRPVTLTTTAAS